MVQTFNERDAIEKLELLYGDRPRARDQAAVRIADLAELLQLAAVQTVEVSAAPTAADFNSLLRDLKQISTRLTVVAQVLQGRIVR
ncbi:hypothetical protein [Sinorhizobium meliloti]|uniref:hypothetical protein n=1 Tax=Rhizobium meliloti TaxID=382 RepID=UPI003F18E8F2